ncbi:MAG: PHP domain-containing protein [Ignavibacteriae bacterium]|nr:PHP domain-containing protein [Ignavibacteriota bacterium]NOG96331.1 PHP domain-containing protein [Ignavibacteriota bacterium]
MIRAKADLHMHTNHSDGHYSPSELIDLVKKNEIDKIAITDHDSINGIEEATECGRSLGIEVIPGVEISTDIEDREVHLLGYFLDTANDELKKYLTFFRQERFHRARRIVQKLKNLGMSISIDDVMDRARNSAVGRPHIANTMVELKLVDDYYEAFDKYLGDNKPAAERKIHVSPQSALKIISDAGGLSFIAHPAYVKESILMTLIKAGLDGIEVVHPSHKEYKKRFYKGIVNQYCLLESGGSDFHGGKKGDFDNLGKYFIDASKVEAMRKRLHKNSA